MNKVEYQKDKLDEMTREFHYDEPSQLTKLKEQYIYGSKRIGVDKKSKTLFDSQPVGASISRTTDHELGHKRYELSNHLNNVLATISDRKVWNDTDGYYEPVLSMWADYYAFGMLMPDRFEGIASDGTRHLFNGMEADGEVSGDGNSYTTQFRQYDPRLGRWKSLDPLMAKYPNQSPYAAFNNNPVYYVDPLGLEGKEGDGGGEGKKKGDTFIGDDGKEHTLTHDEVAVGPGADNSSKPVGYYSGNRELDVAANDQHSHIDIEVPEYETNAEMDERLTRQMLREFQSQPLAEARADKTDHQKLAEYNYDLYGPYVVPGYDIAKKMKDGEQIDASDWFIEGLGIIPAGKLLSKGGKLFLKVGDKTTDISKRGLKNMVCFIAGTPVSTEDGIKPIEDIEVDDLVWAYDEETEDITLKTVYNTVVRETDHLEKLVIGTDTLHTTSNHPFWVSNKWKPAGELIVGDTLTLRSNEKLILNYKEKIDTIATVYNFAVSDYATYFVGEQEVLVHNDNPCAQAVDNMTAFFKSGFGKQLNRASYKTSRMYQGQSIYKVTSKNVKGSLKKGDHYYLDGLHKNHLEVFDSNGNFKQALNLDGTINSAKTLSGQGRKIKL